MNSVLQRLLAALLATLPAAAQTCPPNSLCPQGTTCAPITCPITARSYSVASLSQLAAPPVANQPIQVPRFAGAPGQTLLQAEVLVRCVLTGAVRVQNTSAVTTSVQSQLGTQFVLGSSVPQVNGLAVSVATPLFADVLGPQINPPCTYTGGDAAQHAHLSVERERRACISDPALLSGLFTASGSLTNVEFSVTTLDTSSSTAAGACVVLANQSRVFVTIVYHYCTGVGVGTSTCPGAPATTTACPCANWGLAGQGCANSRSAAGAQLSATGVTSPDTVVLVAQGEPLTALSIFLQGNANAPGGVVFGDGVRCAAGTLKRLYTKSAVAGTVYAPGLSDAGIRFLSTSLGDPIANGTTRWYQVYFRDANASFCPPPQGSTFNVTSALQILWL